MSDVRINLSGEAADLADAEAGETVTLTLTVDSNDGTTLAGTVESCETTEMEEPEEEAPEPSAEGSMAQKAMGMKGKMA